jgi:hypothetical protein
LNCAGLDTLVGFRGPLELAKVGTAGTGVLEQRLGFECHATVKQATLDLAGCSFNGFIGVQFRNSVATLEQSMVDNFQQPILRRSAEEACCYLRVMEVHYAKPGASQVSRYCPLLEVVDETWQLPNQTLPERLSLTWRIGGHGHRTAAGFQDDHLVSHVVVEAGQDE